MATLTLDSKAISDQGSKIKLKKGGGGVLLMSEEKWI